jgi:hypothetical protein
MLHKLDDKIFCPWCGWKLSNVCCNKGRELVKKLEAESNKDRRKYERRL